MDTFISLLKSGGTIFKCPAMISLISFPSKSCIQKVEAFYGNLEAMFDQIHGKEISYNNLLDIKRGRRSIPPMAVLLEPAGKMGQHSGALLYESSKAIYRQRHSPCTQLFPTRTAGKQQFLQLEQTIRTTGDYPRLFQHMRILRQR